MTLSVVTLPPPGYAQELYLDTDFDGLPNRVYRGQGVLIHGIPDSRIVDVDSMGAEDTGVITQTFENDLSNALGAVREFQSGLTP